MYVILDLLILWLAATRLGRLVVVDSLGWWLWRAPVRRWANSREVPAPDRQLIGDAILLSPVEPTRGWRSKLASGLECPWCVGFWLGLGLLTLLALAGGPGEAAAWWRIGAGAFALSWASATLGAWFGDYSSDDD